MAAVAFVAITCLNDRPSGPAGQARASLHLQSVARAPSACGPAPVIHPAKARVLLRQPGHTDSMVFTGTFVNDTVTLNIEVPVTGTTELLDIDAQAIDALGDTVFRARDTVTAKEGDRRTVGYLKLWYSAPDSALAFLTILPRDTSLRWGGTMQMRSTGMDGSDATFSGTIRLSFLSRDPTIVATTAAGALTAQSKTGTTWLVATTWLGICDSTTITTVAPVATVTLTPDTVNIARDGSVQIVAVLKDAAGNQLFGRALTWSSSNANASVDTTGVVKGLVKGAARITATSEGKSATAGIGILAKPVAKVTIAPKPVNVLPAATANLSAVVYDSANAVNGDWPVVWASLHATIATVSATGVVTGVATGIDTVTATAGGVADSVIVTVANVGPTSTVVTPNPDTAFSIHDSLALTAKSYIGATLTAGTYTWVSRDPTIATVNTNGLVIAVANGTTYVVATESNGTKDSARVTVAQRASAISLTPTPVQRYVGTTQTFVAAATDARGNAIAGAPFVWSVSDPSVASVSATGLATMLAIGTDTVKATIGSVVGKAVLTVKSVVTRISVTPVAPSGSTLAAFGRTQKDTAIAYDTLDAPMTGVTFAWASSNPGVATVPGTAGTTQLATAVGNGTTAISASAQGTTGSTTLTVAQVLFSIVAGPTPIAVGPGGSAQLTARGQDSTAHFIPGGTFSWSSNAPTLVTVGASTGVITAVGAAPNSAKVWATSGTIVSDTVLVNIDNTVPARVSFGRDTLAIGRGSLNNSIPVYLSKAPATPITVNLAVQDTIGYFSAPSTVTFAAGQVSANANLNGRNAGSTLVYASTIDFSYLPDTAVLLVQAASHLAAGSYSLNAGDYQPTQVLLTDPAPAGGVYVAFNYSTPGVTQLSPDPAFIPAGQLAANVNVTGIAAGATNVTPSAPGVTGTASSVNIQPAVLAFPYSPRILGEGQQDQDYVYTRVGMVHPLNVTVTNKDSTVANSPALVTILANQNYQYFTTFAYKIGVDTQTVSAPGYAPVSRPVIVTKPRLGACCQVFLNTTSAAAGLTAYVLDSVGSGHPRINPLFVTVTSSDPTIITVIDTLVTVPAGASSISARFKPAGSGGQAYVRVSAGGHSIDSVSAFVTAPALGVSYATNTIGVDQQGTNYGYVYIPNAVATAVPVKIKSSDTTIVAVDTLVTIPANNNYAYYSVRGHRVGTATFTFTAIGYSPMTNTTIVTTPRLTHCCNSTYNNFTADGGFTVYSADSVGNVRPVITPIRVNLASTAPAVITMDSSGVTIGAAASSNSTAHTHITGVGSGSIIMTAPGYLPDTAAYTVVTPTLGTSMGTASMGVRQHGGATGAYAYTPNARPDSVIIRVANAHANILAAADSVKIPKASNYGYFEYSGVSLGRDTLTFTAPGYNPATASVVVTPAQLRAVGVSTTYNTTSPPITVYVTAMDTIGYTHLNMDTVAVRVASSDTTVIKLDSAIIHIPTDRVTSFYAQARFVGPGSARLTFTDSAGIYKPDSTIVMTVVGPVLHFANGTTLAGPVTLGMRQHLGVNGDYVYTDNPVTGSPLVVSLQSTDVTVATVPATVTIPVGLNYGYFDITALDTTGTIQIKATATGYAQALSYVQVGRPKFYASTTTVVNTTTPPGGITVYAEDQTGATRYVTENVSVSLSSANPTVAAPDSTTVTILKDSYYNNLATMRYLSAGTTSLNASDARSVFYKYDPAAPIPISVGTPTVCFPYGCSATITMGLNEYQDTYVYIPNALPGALTVTLGHSTGTTSTPATVVIPAGAYNTPVRISGVSAGPDVITTSALGFSSGAVTVGVDSGTVTLSSWASSMKLGDSLGVVLYTYDQGGSNRPVSSAVTFSFAGSGLSFSNAAGQAITGITVPAGSASTPVFYIHAASSGQATITISGGTFRSYNNSTTVQ